MNDHLATVTDLKSWREAHRASPLFNPFQAYAAVWNFWFGWLK